MIPLFLQNRLKLLSWPKDQTMVSGSFQLWMCATVSVWSRGFIEKSIQALNKVKKKIDKRKTWWLALFTCWQLKVEHAVAVDAVDTAQLIQTVNILTIKQFCKQIRCSDFGDGWKDAHSGLIHRSNTQTILMEQHNYGGCYCTLLNMKHGRWVSERDIICHRQYRYASRGSGLNSFNTSISQNTENINT